VPPGTISGNGTPISGFSPRWLFDGKAQVTREPTGPPAADGAWSSPGSPRPRPSRAATGPFPRAPADHDQDDDRWSGTTPGFEFEGRRSRPPAKPPTHGGGHPPVPPRPARSRNPRAHPGRPAGPHATGPQQALSATGPQQALRPEAPPAPPRRFRYTPTVAQPPAGPAPAPPPDRVWPGDAPADAGFDDETLAAAATRADAPRPAGPPAPPRRPRPPFGGPRPPRNRQREERQARVAGAEWARLLGSLLPPPVKRRWSREFLAGLQFRGWGIRVAIAILAMVVFGVAVVVIAGANSGNAGPTPPAASLGYPPATLAGADFSAAASGRGMTQTLGRAASVGHQIVAVGSQAGGRIARAQFYVSGDDGRTWTMGKVRMADGGVPPPGHGAIFVAGAPGAWVALGSGSVWTSSDGRTWTLEPGPGLPLRPGDQISAVTRTAAGFVAVGASVPGGDAARSAPLMFSSARGTNWQRLDAARLHLAAGGRPLDLKYVAAAGNAILIAGDVLTTKTAGKPKRPVMVQAGAAWLSRDGGATWTATAGQATRPGAQPQLTGLAAAGNGFVLLRPATVAQRPATDVFYSPNGRGWTFGATLSAPGGFTAGMANGGPDGVAVTGQAGGRLTAFVSPNGLTWRQARPFGAAAAEDVSGVVLAPDGAVVTTGISAGPDSRQPVITLTGTSRGPERVDLAKIPGAVARQVAVNAVAAQSSTQVAVGSANGLPAAWTSGDGGTSWTRAAGATPAVFARPGSQQLTSVTHGIMGWLAVGGAVPSPAGPPQRAAQHPVVAVSADGTSWQAVDGERVFAAPGLFTDAAAASGRGYVIVGHQKIRQVTNGRTVVRTVAAAWWSAGLSGWQRAGSAAAGALDSAGNRQMNAVTASGSGFAAVGSHGDQPSVWTSADGGRTWRQADLPLPVGATRAFLEHVASAGRVVTAVGTVVTATGQEVPFAASSADGGASWGEAALPVPAGLTSVTALTAAGGTFTATGTYGRTPGHQDVVVWTSRDGSAWRAAEPAGQGLTGPGIQAITALTVSGSTLTGVGFTASPAGEQPVFWQSPIR
jgi:hypothetical protein